MNLDDLTSKFKAVRRRTAQKVAEKLGVAETHAVDSRVMASYKEYVWLGNYLEKVLNQVTVNNSAIQKMIQTTFSLATQLQAELSPEDDEEALPTAMKRVYSHNPFDPTPALYNRVDVVAGAAGDLFALQAHVNGQPLANFFKDMRTFVTGPIEKEIDQNDALTRLMMEECEEARLDFAAYERRGEQAKAAHAKVALDEEEAQLLSHLATRISARCRLVTSTMAFIVQLQASLFGTLGSSYEQLASDTLPILQLCQMESKVVDMDEYKRRKKERKMQSMRSTEEDESVEEESVEEGRTESDEVVDHLVDNVADLAFDEPSTAAVAPGLVGLDDFFGGDAPLQPAAASPGGLGGLGGLDGLEGLDFNAKLEPTPNPAPVQSSGSTSMLDDFFGAPASTQAASMPSQAPASTNIASFNPFEQQPLHQQQQQHQQHQQQHQQFAQYGQYGQHQSVVGHSRPKHYDNMENDRKVKKVDKTDNALRQKLRQEREAAAAAAAAAKVEELRAEEQDRTQKAQQKRSIDAMVSAQVDKWSGAGSKKSNLRSLISTLDAVLWPDSGWKPVPLSQLMEPKKVRRAWLKAAAIVHPDKVQGESVEKQLLAEKVFTVLRESFDIFKKEL